MRLKRKEFLALKQGGMSVSEYRDKFTQLSRYAPNDVEADQDKQELFMEGLMMGCNMSCFPTTLLTTNSLLTKLLLLRARGVIWRLRSGSSRINSLAIATDLISLRVRTTRRDFRDNLMWQTAPSSSRRHRNSNSRVSIVLKLPAKFKRAMPQ